MFAFWHRWLQIAFAALLLVGIDFALFGHTALFAPLNHPINVHFFGAAQVAPEIELYQRFAFGIMGGLIAGWGLLAFLVSRYAIARREAWAWYGLALGVALWYVVDSGFSAYYGALHNVAGNTLFALPLVIPLFALRKHIFGPAGQAQPVLG